MHSRSRFLIGVCAAAALIGAALIFCLFLPRYPDIVVPPDFDQANPQTVAQGAYVAAAGGCVSCHQMAGGQGAAYAGGRSINTPFGAFISPNITPDKVTGIGNWTAADFLRLMKHGIVPSGQPTFPVFPWDHYKDITTDDALALYAYLQSLDPVVQPQKGNALPFPLSMRPFQTVWRWLFVPETAPPASRGAYLVETLGHCGACHTPRNMLGGRRSDLALAGVRDDNGKTIVPGLTGSSDLADWSSDELATFLRTGTKPDYDTVEGEMALVIDHGTSKLTADDLAAMVTYLKNLP